MVELLQEENREKDREIKELRNRERQMREIMVKQAETMAVQAKTMHQMVEVEARKTAAEMKDVRRK
jgi:hypothetical protein